MRRGKKPTAFTWGRRLIELSVIFPTQHHTILPSIKPEIAKKILTPHINVKDQVRQINQIGTATLP